eukprot:scaffold2103_cov185-Amphora_coffeaeformis.AAC.22
MVRRFVHPWSFGPHKEVSGGWRGGGIFWMFADDSSREHWCISPRCEAAMMARKSENLLL